MSSDVMRLVKAEFQGVRRLLLYRTGILLLAERLVLAGVFQHMPSGLVLLDLSEIFNDLDPRRERRAVRRFRASLLGRCRDYLPPGCGALRMWAFYCPQNR